MGLHGSALVFESYFTIRLLLLVILGAAAFAIFVVPPYELFYFNGL